MPARDGRRKVLLVSASHYEPDGSVARVGRYWTSGLTLVHLEALTPPEFACELVDDFRREPPLDTDADLVGITAMGLQIGRAYRLADQYRARGLPVVMGGEWVSLNPEQALVCCDAIVKGEAEYAWPDLLADAQRGGFRKRIYQGETLHDLRGLPEPDLDHLPLWRPELMREKVYREFYFQFPLYVTRGCPFHGGTYRKRPVGEVLRDLDAIRAKGSRNVLFMDDNPVGGTPFYDRMEKEGRILTRDWNRYHYGSAVIRPKRMTPEMAEQKFWATYRDFFSMRSILRRFFPPAPRNLKIQMHYLTANLIFRKLQQSGKHPYLY